MQVNYEKEKRSWSGRRPRIRVSLSGDTAAGHPQDIGAGGKRREERDGRRIQERGYIPRRDRDPAEEKRLGQGRDSEMRDIHRVPEKRQDKPGRRDRPVRGGDAAGVHRLRRGIAREPEEHRGRVQMHMNPLINQTIHHVYIYHKHIQSRIRSAEGTSGRRRFTCGDMRRTDT